jgi:hypothetical protein
MRVLKLAIPACFLAAGFAITTSTVFGVPEYSRIEKKSCTFCHAKVSSDRSEMARNLNAAGTCYKNNDHSLAKCAKK